MRCSKKCKSISKSTGAVAALLSAFTLALGTSAIPANAQDDTGYRTTETSKPFDPQATDYDIEDKAANNGDLTKEGPVRMARFSYVTGNVTWRPDSTSDWTQATNNMPLRQGAEILVLKGGRADVQFDDGSSLRLGNSAMVAFKTMFSDAKGEFTQITLKDGLATMRSRHSEAVFEIDTPVVSVRTTGASQVRLGVDGGSEVAVQMGSAVVEGPQGKVTISEGNYVYLTDRNTAYNQHKTPSADTWDRWNLERDKLVSEKSETYKHVPSNIGLVAEDLDSYGNWHEDNKYGWVWTPRVEGADWRPYNKGHWVWVEPYGWTWVGEEPWGWAPYHYGTWCQLSYGWSWCPGSRYQYWSPGVVSFCDYGGGYGWAPLCPWEVRYPSYCSVGRWGSDWCLNFSIGWAGCYFPFGNSYCEGRRFDNRYVNNSNHGFDNRFASRDRFNNSLESRGGNSGFVPFNGRNVAGATSASKAAFGGRGSYTSVPKGNSNMFSMGRTVTGVERGTPVSGPSGASQTEVSRTTTRSFVRTGPSEIAASRSTFGSTSGSANGSQASDRRAVTSNSNGIRSGGFRSPGSVSESVNRTSTSAADAARQARASLGSISGSGYNRTGNPTGGGSSYLGRTTVGGSSDTPRSIGGGDYSRARSQGTSRGSSSGSNSGSDYRVGSGYRGTGYSRSSGSVGGGGSRSSGGSSSGGGGGRSGGGNSSGGGGGGGGRSNPGGGGRH